jgi:hypothetical protein
MKIQDTCAEEIAKSNRRVVAAPGFVNGRAFSSPFCCWRRRRPKAGSDGAFVRPKKKASSTISTSGERADRLPHAHRLREAIEGIAFGLRYKKASIVKSKVLVVSTSGKPPLVDEGSALRCRQSHWHAPLSVQTVPHGQPVPPGAQLA